jgi:hypothetical protein
VAPRDREKYKEFLDYCLILTELRELDTQYMLVFLNGLQILQSRDQAGTLTAEAQRIKGDFANTFKTLIQQVISDSTTREQVSLTAEAGKLQLQIIAEFLVHNVPELADEINRALSGGCKALDARIKVWEFVPKINNGLLDPLNTLAETDENNQLKKDIMRVENRIADLLEGNEIPDLRGIPAQIFRHLSS